MPDTRESVLINKLALEYRRIRCMALTGSDEAISNNAALQVYNGMRPGYRQNMDYTHIKEFTKLKKRENFMNLKVGMIGNHTYQKHFVQATP